MSSTAHTEGASVSQQSGASDAPNIIIMENNIINCGDPNYVNLTSAHHNQQQLIGAPANNRKGAKQNVVTQNKINKAAIANKQIITNSNIITGKEKVFSIQAGKTPKTMYAQQVYTTTIPSSQNSTTIIQQQQHKIPTMPRNVQVVTKGANNMILCRSPSSSGANNNNNTSGQIQIQEQQYHQLESNHQQPAYTTMKTIYVNNNPGGLNLNKSNKIVTNVSSIDYSPDPKQQPKFITQKIVQSSPTSELGDNKYAFKFTSVSSPSMSGTIQAQVVQNSNGNNNKGMVKSYNNNCTVKTIQQTSQPAFYYQPTTVYTSDNTITYKSTAAPKINSNVKSQGPQYVQVSQNHRMSTNTYTPAPIQKHRTSTTNKYVIHSVAPPSQTVPVSSSNQQQVRYATNNQTASVISYSPEQPSVIQSPMKMRTVLHPVESTGMEDGARIYTVSETHADEVDSGNTISNSYNSSSNYSDNYMIVNGTKMTDEMSARILHDLSQRSSIKFNNANSNINNNSNSSENITNVTPEIMQPQTNTVYARQQDGTTMVWNSASVTPSDPQIIRRTSESSANFIAASPIYQPEYKTNNDELNSQSLQQQNIIYQTSSQTQDRSQLIEQDEEVIYVEERPAPIPLTADGKLNILYAVLQDHTYCTPMTPRPMPSIITTEQTFSTMNPNLESNTVAAAAVLSSMPGAAKLFKQHAATPVPTQQLLVPQPVRDDDANSTISTGSHPGLYIDQGEDPGEETETALEGEGEDDSETKCICELTHDDGYMICCDTCSTWQHVDCMKIDRQNIPDEYQCVNCCPREVDALAARTLQLQKRKEQSALQLYPVASIYEGVAGKAPPGKLDKKNNLTVKQRKKDLLSSKKNKNDPNHPKNKKRSESGARSNGKRKELKKISKKKLKQNSDANTPDKMTSTLRNWIDNYEVAMTNHYSPELRARLQALSKQATTNNQVGNEIHEPRLQWFGELVPICTTVPHAGAKILISTRNIEPNTTITEIRGKYMLDIQQKQANNAQIGQKKPASGSFLFFYSVPKGGPDVCVDTRTYGNEARFVRRSCRPNAEIVHNIEKNVIHLYIVARQKIMEGAEITIAHDLNVDPMTRTHSMSHTSTLCACGLVRDCKFATALGATPPIMSPTQNAPPLFAPNVMKRKNGTHTQGTEVKEKRKYKKRKEKEKPPKEQKENRGRGRSTSSSAESNTGLLSPPLKNYDIHPDFIRSAAIPPTMHIMPSQAPHEQLIETVNRSITPIIHPDPNVFYENAAIQVRHIEVPPQHQPEQIVHEIVQQQLQQQQQQQQLPPQQQHKPVPLQHIQFSQPPEHAVAVLPKSPERTPIQNSVNEIMHQPVPAPAVLQSPPTTTIVLPPVIKNEEPRAVTPVQMTPVQVPPVPIPTVTNINVVPVPVQIPKPLPTEVIPKSPPVTPQKPNKRGSKSQRNSINEPAVVPNEDHLSTSTVPNTPSKEENESLLKSAEKETKESTSTEKRKLTREERKMEAIVKAFEKMEKNQQRKQEQKAHKSAPKKQRNTSTPSPNKNSILHNKRKMMSQKRKKRKSKSQSHNKRDSKHSGESSDVVTSSEENIIKSSAVNSLAYQSTFNNVQPMSSSELLLSYSQLKTETDTNLSGIPPLISPACMLIEAAVGNLEQSANSQLENAFKFPHKTKTKKTIMNEWLHQADGNAYPKSEHDSGYMSEGKPNDLALTHSSKLGTYDPDIKMVAKKVEEFICQNNISYNDEEPLSLVKNEFNAKTLTTPPQANSPQTENSCSNFAGSESAVKKRWLRQAISEETADDNCNSQQNEFTTPLKKRRVVIEQIDDESPSTSMDLSLGSVTKVEKMDDEGSQDSEIKQDEKIAEAVRDIKEEILRLHPADEGKIEMPENSNQTDIKIEADFEMSIKQEEDPTIPTSTNDITDANSSDTTTLTTTTTIKNEEDDEKSSNLDEMAQYQKVIASFHNENIMMLQTRNKKKEIVGESPTKTPKKTNLDLSDSDINQASSKKLSSRSPPHEMQEPDSSSVQIKYHQQSVSPDTTSQPITNDVNSSLSTSILAQTLTSPAITPVAETIPFGSSRYLNNIGRSEVPSILATAPPPILNEIEQPYSHPTEYHTSFTYRPMMTNLTMNEYPETINSLVPNSGPYMPSFNKATLIAATTPTGATLTGQYATVGSSFGSAFTSAIPMNDSAFLGNSFSTLNDTSSASSGYYSQKIYTKTASSDPRLNPNLNPPEETKPDKPAQPKKKLSLTEYRKRKAQSTDSASNDGCSENIVTTNTGNTTNLSGTVIDNNNSDTKNCEASPVKACTSKTPSPVNEIDNEEILSSSNIKNDNESSSLSQQTTEIDSNDIKQVDPQQVDTSSVQPNTTCSDETTTNNLNYTATNEEEMSTMENNVDLSSNTEKITGR